MTTAQCIFFFKKAASYYHNYAFFLAIISSAVICNGFTSSCVILGTGDYGPTQPFVISVLDKFDCWLSSMPCWQIIQYFLPLSLEAAMCQVVTENMFLDKDISRNVHTYLWFLFFLVNCLFIFCVHKFFLISLPAANPILNFLMSFIISVCDSAAWRTWIFVFFFFFFLAVHRTKTSVNTHTHSHTF